MNEEEEKTHNLMNELQSPSFKGSRVLKVKGSSVYKV
jgi:hypothetical protein